MTCLVVLAAGLSAQRPPSWSPQPLTQPYSPGLANQLGKVLAYVDGGIVHTFSAFTRTWATLPTAGTAPIRVANDWALVEDGVRLHAFGSYRGAYATITTSPGATILNPVTQRNDSILVVRDGGDLLTFSGFTGTWTRTPIPVSAQLAVQRHTLVVADGTQLWGMSAFDGRFVTTTFAGGGFGLHADGTVGIVETAQTVHGFSALRRTWSSAPSLGGSALRRESADCVIWHDGAAALAFSGLRGSFSLNGTGAPVALQIDEGLGVVQTSVASYLYSAVHGTWRTLPTPASVNWNVRTHAALFVDANATHAFSALTGNVTTWVGAAQQQVLNNTAGAVLDANGRVQMWSAFTGAFVAAPNDVAPFTVPRMTWNGGLLPTTTGCTVFSARSGRFVPQVVNDPSFQFHADDPSGILAVRDGVKVSVFEPRRETWLTHTFASIPQVFVWRTVLLAYDNAQALGFGALAGMLEIVTLPTPVVASAANSESARIVVGNTIVAFAATNDLTPLAQFPEFRRLYVSGAPLDLAIAGAPGASAVACLSLALAPAPIPLPFGDFLLATTSPLVPLPFATLDGAGRANLSLAVPDLAAAAGLSANFQALVLPPAGTPYLTPLAAVTLF